VIKFSLTLWKLIVDGWQDELLLEGGLEWRVGQEGELAAPHHDYQSWKN